MKIVLDAFGGDNAPEEILKGAVEAKNEFNTDILLAGNRDKILRCAEQISLDVSNMEILNAETEMTMEDSPSDILKSKSNSSMAVAIRAVADGAADAVITAGNSGAACVGGTMILKRIKGIKRPAFSPIMPNSSGCFMLLDGGANIECRADMLYQFAVMGSIYMNKVMNIDNPRVALANCGTEEHKGPQLYREAYELLKDSGLNFVGNIEGRDIPLNGAQVVVADGFTGNLILKTYEGAALAIMTKIKELFSKGVNGKLAAALVMSDLKKMKKTFDYKEYGGAPILGCSKPIFKAHGSSKARTIKIAVGQTIKYIESDVISAVTEALQSNDNK